MRHPIAFCALIIVMLGVSGVTPTRLSAKPIPTGEPTPVNRAITVTGRLFYNDLRQYGHFEWRRDKNGKAGTQQKYADGHRVNYLGLRDATVQIYEIDEPLFANTPGCFESELMGSTTVAEDGSFTWSGTLADVCSPEADGVQGVSLAVKILLRFCDAAMRCIEVRDPGTDRDAVEADTFNRWHRLASKASPRFIAADGAVKLADDEFESRAAGTVTDLDAQAANVFASLVDVTRAFHVNDTVPFLYDEYGTVYVVFPTQKPAPSNTSSAQRIDIVAPGTEGATRTPTTWLSGQGVMHEVGHAMQRRAFQGKGNNIDYSFGGNGSWSISSKEYPQTAFSEGWANFVTRAALEDVPKTATTDYYGCSGAFDTGPIYGCAGTVPCNDGHWYAGNVTKALCDWFDSSFDRRDVDGDHWRATSLHSMWLNLVGMYSTATAQQRSAGLDFCHWVGYYINVRKAGDPSYKDAITDLITNNGITCP